MGILIGGIDELARQISGFVADNRKEFGPALTKLNLVLDNLETRRAQIDDSLRRLPSFASQLGEVVGSGPGFSANVYGVPPPQITGMALDAYFQPGKLPDSLADFLRGFMLDRRHHQTEVTVIAVREIVAAPSTSQRRARRLIAMLAAAAPTWSGRASARYRSRRTSPRRSGCIRATR